MPYTCWKVHHALASKLLSSLLYSLSIPRRGASVSLLQRRDSDGLLITYLINLLGATKDGQTKSCMYNSHERMVHCEASEWKKYWIVMIPAACKQNMLAMAMIREILGSFAYSKQRVVLHELSPMVTQLCHKICCRWKGLVIVITSPQRYMAS